MDNPAAVSPRTPPLQRLAPTGEAARVRAAESERIGQLTGQLLALGHQRILLVAVREHDAARVDAELQGHCQVMLAAGLPLLPHLELDSVAAPLWPELAGTLEAIAPTVLLCTHDALLPPLQAALRHARLAHLIVVGPEHGTLALGVTRH